jgi:hypothetical protein
VREFRRGWPPSIILISADGTKGDPPETAGGAEKKAEMPDLLQSMSMNVQQDE